MFTSKKLKETIKNQGEEIKLLKEDIVQLKNGSFIQLLDFVKKNYKNFKQEKSLQSNYYEYTYKGVFLSKYAEYGGKCTTKKNGIHYFITYEQKKAIVNYVHDYFTKYSDKK